jgi:hypothetical protein
VGDGEPISAGKTIRLSFLTTRVERTIAWIGRYRRLSKEYEYLPESSETLIYLAMSRLMLRWLVCQAPYGVPSPQRQGLI